MADARFSMTNLENLGKIRHDLGFPKFVMEIQSQWLMLDFPELGKSGQDQTQSVWIGDAEFSISNLGNQDKIRQSGCWIFRLKLGFRTGSVRVCSFVSVCAHVCWCECACTPVQVNMHVYACMHECARLHVC